jgi:hypothetical protein
VSRAGLLMWFGLCAPPAAWTVQHVAGIGISQGICGVAAGPGGDHTGLDAWNVGVAIGALAIGVAGLVAAIVSWRRTRDVGTDPPGARIHFLTIVALTTTPLFLAIIVLSGFSDLFMSGCRQS